MKCDFCELDAKYIVHDGEVNFVCVRHLEENFPQDPFEEICSSRLFKAALDEAEKVLESLFAGKVVKFVHPRHPEVHWSYWDRSRDAFIERVVDSLNGEVCGSFEFRKLQTYLEILGKAIANGWMPFETKLKPEQILNGGER